MKRPVRIHNLGGARAIILHRPHPTVQALTRQLTAIGLTVSQVWPELDASALGADFVFFDADMGHDDQFPWAPGCSPMPMIALIGSEAPGRIEWSLEAGAHAQMLKPVGDNGAYATLLVARAAFDAQAALNDEIAGLRRRIGERQNLIRAVTLLAERGEAEADAYGRLRQMAMAWRVTLEEAAVRVVATGPDSARHDGGRQDGARQDGGSDGKGKQGSAQLGRAKQRSAKQDWTSQDLTGKGCDVPRRG